MKLKTLLYLNEWISHAPAVNRSPDSQLRPTPGGFNDNSPNWDGVTEGKGWFCYVEANDWHNKLSGASVYITEDEKKPVKMWIKIKTHGLRKNSDTNESHIKRIRKHADKVAGAWMSEAKKIHNNLELNEAGNPITVSWKAAFKEALNHPKVSAHLAEHGEKEITPLADPVNFTPRIGETDNMVTRDISYSAVVLKEEDQHKLLDALKNNIPEGWKTYAHHMTIKMGALPTEKKNDVGKEVKLVAKEVGLSDKAMAVKVDGYPTSNQIAHVTIAVNISGGGKPVDSNKIMDWKPLPHSLDLRGNVVEIPFPKR